MRKENRKITIVLAYDFATIHFKETQKAAYDMQRDIQNNRFFSETSLPV